MFRFVQTVSIIQLLSIGLISSALAQQSPHDVFPEAQLPYYRVRYEGSDVRVVVHQHGCGEGSCKSGLTGAYDLHWQALARTHDCALLAPSYEQPQAADCQLWCDPRNGSSKAFQQSPVGSG